LFSLDPILQDLYSNTLKLIIEKENLTDYLNILLCILSKLHVTESKENELLSWLYSQIFMMCDSDQIELALYSRKNLKFLKKWHQFVDDKNIRAILIDSIKTAQQISNVIFYTSYNLHKPYLNAKELTLRVIIRDLHWFLDILVKLI
jgi:hypothetical protein